MPEIFDHALDQPAHAAIHAEEKDPKKSDRDDYDSRGYNHFVPRRPSHLAHFNADFMQKTTPAAGIFAKFLHCRRDRVPAAVPSATVPAFLQFDRFRHRHSQILPDSPLACPVACQNGRGGGIRTPTLGFGDRWSTVEPTPLYPEREPVAPTKGSPRDLVSRFTLRSSQARQPISIFSSGPSPSIQLLSHEPRNDPQTLGSKLTRPAAASS